MDNSDTIRIDDKDVDLIIDGEKYYKINNKYSKGEEMEEEYRGNRGRI